MNSIKNDVHSYSNSAEVVIKHLDLNVEVDFAKKIIAGKAKYRIENLNNAREIIFDSNNLTIEKITLDEKETPAQFHLGPTDKHLGQALHVGIQPQTQYLTIYYQTNPNAAALLWLDPEQTAGKEHPFLFTQSEAILARSWIPVQDSPGIRITYEATVKVPPSLLALMSAKNPQVKNDSGIYHFTMERPIPPYLLALAVGDIQFKAIGPRTGVYAEPSVVNKATYELEDMENMLTNAEKLYGPYAWERYDVLVLPPSFPFGGMENPRLTFATPTILVGDRSLVSLIAHELAHSWSGNLVTNATWNDFWLNEGFTVYFERRIMEEQEGKDYSDMLEELGYYDLVDALKEVKPQFTSLKTNLTGYDPDEGLTRIPYEKGYFLLRFIEEQVGRESFDSFLNQYFQEFAFQTVTTEQFLSYLQNNLVINPSLLEKINSWIYEPGMPKEIIFTSSQRFAKVKENLKRFEQGTPATDLAVNPWSTQEWEYFIHHLPSTLTLEEMSELDKAFNFTQSGNIKITSAWFSHVIQHHYTNAYEAIAYFLQNVGRRHYVLQVYKALAATPEGKAWALEIYKKARVNYHSVTRNSVDKVLGYIA
ncbi:M1 family metallopeptidase [Legionella adelaidensis]|nr:M1 family metallopeptidase [Legionella adelaidensis]